MKIKETNWFTYHCSRLSLCEFEPASWSIFTILLATQRGTGSPLVASPRVLWSAVCYSAHGNLDFTCCLPGHGSSHMSYPCPKSCISEPLWRRGWSWSSLEPRKDSMVDLSGEGWVCWAHRTEDIIMTRRCPLLLRRPVSLQLLACLSGL